MPDWVSGFGHWSLGKVVTDPAAPAIDPGSRRGRSGKPAWSVRNGYGSSTSALAHEGTGSPLSTAAMLRAADIPMALNVAALALPM